MIGLIDAPHTQKFVNFKSLEETQKSKKKIKNVFEIFVTKLESSNFSNG
jgi:hypothetical protein